MDAEELKDVPEEKVPDVVKRFIQSGAAEVVAKRQADGKWTVSAK